MSGEAADRAARMAKSFSRPGSRSIDSLKTICRGASEALWISGPKRRPNSFKPFIPCPDRAEAHLTETPPRRHAYDSKHRIDHVILHARTCRSRELFPA